MIVNESESLHSEAVNPHVHMPPTTLSIPSSHNLPPPLPPLTILDFSSPAPTPPNRVLQPIAENSSESSPSPQPPKVPPHPFARFDNLRLKTLYPPPRPNIRQSNITNDQWETGDEISPVEEEKPMNFQGMYILVYLILI